MSNLREELTRKVMNQWDGVTMDVSVSNKTLGEKIFEWVTAHPYSGVDEVEKGLGLDKSASVSSYMKSLLDRGLVGREQKVKMPYPGIGSRHYYVYYPMSTTYQGAKVKHKKQVGRPKKQAVLVTPTHEHVLRPRMPQAFNPEMFVQDLSLKEARAVFDVLKGYFG